MYHTMPTVVIAIILVALAVFLLSFNIIFRKEGKFPDTEIGHNTKLREMGIRCSRVEEMALWAKSKKQANRKIIIDPSKIRYAPKGNP